MKISVHNIKGKETSKKVDLDKNIFADAQPIPEAPAEITIFLFFRFSSAIRVGFS